ncbi:heparinase II/III family protein [Paenibacillus sp. N3.4]|uniref:heparinase II/III domain-containing protein n=1 Tax=Paenibacillus sp. N3.4 TaxID=2603222 RepID=UPI0011CAE60C|nr:heparinase II/III family protein [Paenibacillus sp. N3.4]TXK71269.1 alginate lyase family protein [Paenibacillus sp. N3.4]
MSRAVRLNEKLDSKVQRLEWVKGIAISLKEEIDRLRDAGSLSIPLEPGGWWHQYVCPKHHTELEFDPFVADAAQFLCPHGCEVEGAEYRGAWLVFKHQLLARVALQSAAVYAALREASYAELSKRLIIEYAAQFPLYPVHPDAQSWMLRGRAFHQALTEAIWSTTLIRAYLLLLDEGVVFSGEEQGKIDTFLTLLDTSMTEYRGILVHERKNAENNYTAWLNASLSCVYAARRDRQSIGELIVGEGGFRHHLSIGVKPDQLEFEGSTYYHIFVLRAYLISAEMAERCGIDLYACEGTEGQSIQGMFVALAELADDQGVLPALHDGPMGRLPYAREIAEIAEQGLARYAIEGLAPILREAYRQMGSPDGLRIQLEALLYGAGEVPADIRNRSSVSSRAERSALVSPSPPRGSKLWPDSGFVVGRHAGNPLSFLVDFGEHGGAHGHYDKLHLTLIHEARTLTPDFGVVPYGSSLRTWFSETASHNTVSLDGTSQAAHTGRCERFEQSEAATYAWLQSDAAYAECRLDRHLLLTGDWLLDWFQVSLEGGVSRSIEWWMHPVVAAVSEQHQELSAEKEEAYPPISIQPALPDLKVIGRFVGDEKQLNSDNPVFMESSDGVIVRPSHAEIHAKYTLVEGTDVFHTALALPGDELLAVQTPGDSVDPSVPLTALLHRHIGNRASFIHVYRASSGVALRLVSDNTIEVSAQGCSTTIRMSQDQGLQIV